MIKELFLNSLKRLLPLILVLVLIVLLTGALVFFMGTKVAIKNQRIDVAVSVLPQAQVVERVGGERVRVTVMIPPGKSPQTYSPSPEQLRRFAVAKLYFKVGHPLFPFESAHFDRLIKVNKDILVVDGGESGKLLPHDAHLWLSTGFVAGHVRLIRDALIKIDPDGKRFYKENARAFLEEIEALGRELKRRLGPYRGRKFFVYHPAWGYFAREFDLVQRALQKHHKAPGPKDMERFIKELQEENAKIIFVQKQFDQRHADIVARAIGGEVKALDPLARDWLNNMRKVGRKIEKALK